MLDNSEITELGQLDEEKLQTSLSGASSDGVRFRNGTLGSSSSSAGQQKVGPRFPDKPLLPAHNPPAFNFIDDVVPILRPLRSIFKFGKRHVEEILDDKATQRRLLKKKYKKVYSGSNIPSEINYHISNCMPCPARRWIVQLKRLSHRDKRSPA